MSAQLSRVAVLVMRGELAEAWSLLEAVQPRVDALRSPRFAAQAGFCRAGLLAFTGRLEESVEIVAGLAAQLHPSQNSFLELILASLKQGGFVESRRGAEGGYLLARSAAQITIGEVHRFFEGGQNGVRGLKRKQGSPFDELWRQVDAAVSTVVDHTTFADLQRSWAEKQDRFVPNWDI